jgi:acetyl-CoA carboxylase biotin carboxyl carrier protein
MELNDDEIIRIVRLIEGSSFDEFELETNDLKLQVSRGTITSTGTHMEQRLGESQMLAGSQGPIRAPETNEIADVAVPIQKNLMPSTEEPLADEAELLTIKATSVGTFYRASKPGAPPFVEIGSFVNEGDTVCILEVMKLFISVKAGVRGFIEKICVQNAEMVESEQTLFLVKPGESPGESSARE